MAKTLARFSALDIDRLAAVKSDKTRMHHDGGGLYLCVDKRGSANWVYRYTLDGQARTMGLGAFPTIGLSKARKAVGAAREARASRKDPLDQRAAEREAKRAALRQKVTFKKAAQDYIASKRDEWKNPKHAAQWPSTLESYVYPIIGDLAVNDVDNAAVLRVLQQDVVGRDGKTKERLWTAKPETASRLRGRLEAILGWATAGGLRTGDNPARWTGQLEHQLPSKSKLPKGKVTHHRALAIDDVPSFMTRLRERSAKGISANDKMVAALECFRGFSDAQITLIAKALPANSSLEPLPHLLHEWAESALPEHLALEPYPEKSRRNARLRKLFAASDEQIRELSGLTDTDIALLAHHLAGERGDRSYSEIREARRAWERAVETRTVSLAAVRDAAAQLQVMVKRGNPPNRIAYLVMLDFAEIFKAVTGEAPSRIITTYSDGEIDTDGKDTGPFFGFMSAVWAALFPNGQAGLPAAMKRWREMSVNADEQSPFIANFLARIGNVD